MHDFRFSLWVLFEMFDDELVVVALDGLREPVGATFS